MNTMEGWQSGGDCKGIDQGSPNKEILKMSFLVRKLGTRFPINLTNSSYVGT